MAVFKYYNIQLLPLDSGVTTEIGENGYKKFFEGLKEKLSHAKSKKEIELVSSALANNYYLCPFSIDVKESFAFGKFIKYQKVEKVSNLYTGADEFEGGKGSVSKSYEFLFAYDYANHTLAIQKKAGLPSANPLMECLDKIFSPVCDKLFPEHTLKIKELTSAESLERVYEADNYKKVEIDLTFSNSADYEDEIIADLEKDLKGNNVHTLSHTEKPEKGSYMTGLTKISKAFLPLATRFGNATVRYIKDGVSDTYRMLDYPVELPVRKSKNETSEGFLYRVAMSTRQANEKTNIGEKIKRMIRG
nr:DUF4747 family protein [Halomonas sp. NO4]